MLDNNIFAACTHLLGGGHHATHGCIDGIADAACNINTGVIGGTPVKRVRTVAEAGGNDLGVGRPDDCRCQPGFFSARLFGLKIGLCGIRFLSL
ncbi:hypothetical protein D3C81_2102110 [compost metagenome]